MLSVKLIDGTLIKEPELSWNSIPTNEVIRYIDFKISGQTIRLMGYERYLRLKEMVQGVNVTLKRVSKVILVGQIGMMCDRVVIDMINSKISKENVSFDVVYNGQAIDNKYWRAGEISDNPNVFIKQD
jgi:hypothetical protein